MTDKIQSNFKTMYKIAFEILLVCLSQMCLQCIDVLVGREEGHPACKKPEWWGAGMVICLERNADLHMPSRCHCHSLSLASVKSRLVLPFWYRLTWVVPDKGPLNRCVCNRCDAVANDVRMH